MNTTTTEQAETARFEITEICNKRLADAVDLQMQCKYAHWNVKGPNFRALHGLFDEVNADVEDYVDLIAERTVQLGGIADYTGYVVPLWAHLTEYRGDRGAEHDYVQTLATALASFGKLTRQAIAKCTELDDAVSADIFTEITRGTDKWLWMVQAHL